jgi:hypothetical protein
MSLAEVRRERGRECIYIIERMQADAIAFAEASGMEASDELAHCGACLAGGD